jgi:hypothetical protein
LPGSRGNVVLFIKPLHMKLPRLLILLAGLVWISGCTSPKKISGSAAPGIRELRFVNEFVLPGGMKFGGTTVGGLSGIDYDAKKDLYYLICDDPSSRGPARFYTVRIPVSENGIDSVSIAGVNILLDRQGNPYPDITKDRIHSADLEAMRYDPTRDEMIWSSEGQRIIRTDKQELQDPAIVITDRNGRYKDSFALPANMHTQAAEKGPRHNSVFEGVSFDNSYRHVYVSVEEPLYEDGPRAGTGDSTAWIRLMKFDRDTRKQVAQYAYQVDAVPHPANPPGAFKLNGVSDILYAGNDQFIVIERAYSTGRIVSDIRVYLADARNAADISAVPSLKSQPVKKPVTKKLLLDMNSLARFVDNIEGVTFGPALTNGHRSLIFVADDNFDAREKNQFFLFEVLP